jgi:acyl-CoA synthetase (NDP forming)
MLLASRPGRGRRVAIVGDSGGQGAIAADALAREGLIVPTLPDAVTSELAALLPSGAAVTNPVDLAGAGERDLASYARALDAVAASDNVDAVLLTGYFGSYGRHAPALVAAEIEVAGRIGAIQAARELPVVVHSMAPESRAAQALVEHGVPVYGTVDAAARALGGWAELANRPGRVVEPHAPGVAGPPRGGRPGFGYWDARALLVGAGVPYPAARLVTDRASAVSAAAELRAPYVLKADWLDHKSEFGGLALGLADATAVGEAFDRMRERLGPDAAGEVPVKFVLEELDGRAPAVEIIVGARRDPCFGPTVLVGAGGTEAELYRDTAVELAPVSHDEALAMLRRLRSFPLLAGWRGRPAADLTALANLVTGVSRLIAERTDLLDVELNPVRVCRDGVLAVDALVTGKGA